MLMKDLFRIDYERKTLAELFELYQRYAVGDEPQQEALDDLETLRRWKITDRVSGVSSPIVEVTPALPEGRKLVLVDGTIAGLYSDGSTRPGNKVWLHSAQVMWDGELRRLDFSPGEGLKIGGWRRTPEPLSKFIPLQPPPKEITNDDEPNTTDAAPADVPSQEAAPHETEAASEPQSSGDSATLPPWQPRATDEASPNSRQQRCFDILKVDRRLSQCRTATEMMEAVKGGLAGLERILERTVNNGRWPTNPAGGPPNGSAPPNPKPNALYRAPNNYAYVWRDSRWNELLDGGPLARDQLSRVLHKFFPDGT